MNTLKTIIIAACIFVLGACGTEQYGTSSVSYERESTTTQDVRDDYMDEIEEGLLDIAANACVLHWEGHSWATIRAATADALLPRIVNMDSETSVIVIQLVDAAIDDAQAAC